MKKIEQVTMYHVRHSFSFLVLLLLIHFSTARDSLTTDQTLEDGQLLVSANETFALGFFSPGKSKSRYLGIWYNKVSETTVVWVANRDNPINNTSGVLSFDNSGNLVIHGPDLKNPVWSTDFSGPGKKNYSVQLLDTGNLVVFGEDDRKGGVVAWQSFENPTDTMLPMMKLGGNRKTGSNWFLTSWKSLDDPGTGEYSYRMNLREYSEIFLYKGSDIIWRAGAWNGVRLVGVPQMSSTSRFVINVTYVDDQDEVYVMNGMRDPSVYAKMVVNQSGIMERMTWNQDKREWVVFWSGPEYPCDKYGHCGPNGNCGFPDAGKFECSCLAGFEAKSPHDWDLRDGSDGCVRKLDSNVCGSREGFVKLSGPACPQGKLGNCLRPQN